MTIEFCGSLGELFLKENCHILFSFFPSSLPHSVPGWMWSPWGLSGPQLQLQVLDCLPPGFDVTEKWISDILGSILQLNLVLIDTSMLLYVNIKNSQHTPLSCLAQKALAYKKKLSQVCSHVNTPPHLMKMGKRETLIFSTRVCISLLSVILQNEFIEGVKWFIEIIHELWEITGFGGGLDASWTIPITLLFGTMGWTTFRKRVIPMIVFYYSKWLAE